MATDENIERTLGAMAREEREKFYLHPTFLPRYSRKLRKKLEEGR